MNEQNERDIFKLVSPYKPTGDQPEAIAKLVEGMTVDQVEARLSGIKCGMRKTSCPDQLAQAVRKAAEQAGKSQEDQAG